MKSTTVTFFKDWGLAYSESKPCSPSFTGKVHKIVFLCFGLEVEVIEAYRGKAIK